jgi:hypothetical protein
MEYNVTDVTQYRFKISPDRRRKILHEYRRRVQQEHWISAAEIEEQVRDRHRIPHRTWSVWLMNIREGRWTWDGEPTVQKKVS